MKHIGETKIEPKNSNHTLETNDCNLDNVFCGVQNTKVRLQKGKGEDSLSEIQRGSKGQHTKKKTTGDTNQLKMMGREYQKMESELKKCTYSLYRAKGKLSGHRKRTSKRHLLSGEGRGQDLSGHGKIVGQQGTLTSLKEKRPGLVRM